MSRIRTIKPDFFMDEELAELTSLHRRLLIGLVTAYPPCNLKKGSKTVTEWLGVES